MFLNYINIVLKWAAWRLKNKLRRLLVLGQWVKESLHKVSVSGKRNKITDFGRDLNTFRCEEEENRKKNEDYDLEAGCIEESGKLSKDCDAIRRYEFL